VSRLARDTDAVLIDLRGFGQTNRGSVYCLAGSRLSSWLSWSTTPPTSHSSSLRCVGRGSRCLAFPRMRARARIGCVCSRHPPGRGVTWKPSSASSAHHSAARPGKRRQAPAKQTLRWSKRDSNHRSRSACPGLCLGNGVREFPTEVARVLRPGFQAQEQLAAIADHRNRPRKRSRWTRDHSRRHAMACDAMLPQQVTYRVSGPRGVLTSGFVFGVATHFAVLGKPRRTVVS
jgi:hypothetical protein